MKVNPEESKIVVVASQQFKVAYIKRSIDSERSWTKALNFVFFLSNDFKYEALERKTNYADMLRFVLINFCKVSFCCSV